MNTIKFLSPTQIKLTMSKIKFTYNKVYKYVKGRSVVELFFDGICVALFGIFVVGWTSFIINLVKFGV